MLIGRVVVEYQVLGTVGITAETAFHPLEGRLGLLLSVLLSRVNEPVPADFLIESVWGGAGSANPRGSLQVAINRLRRLIEPERTGDSRDLVSVGNGYSLKVDDERYDARAFEADLRTAKAARSSGDPIRARSRLERGLARWHGHAFGAHSDALAVNGEADRLEEMRRAAEDELVDLFLELGEHVRAIPLINKHIDADPFRERRWAQLMLALFRSNRQAEALRAYQQLRMILSEELGIEPSEDLKGLEEAILLQDDSLAARPSILPSHTSSAPTFPTAFIGRKTELAEIRSALGGRSRLVTLVGIGGIGKTRLAAEAAREICEQMAHGCVYANLYELVSDQPLEPYLIRQAGGGVARSDSNRQMLLDLLRPREVLLLLDNAETLVEAVRDLVVDLSESCPQVNILVTSRVPLRVSGERIIRVPPMDIPGDGDSTTTLDSLDLLLDRIGGPDGHTELTPDLVDICKLTGGLPLAIELAASMLGSTSAAELVGRLRKDVDTLESSPAAVDQRHSLRAVVAWSIGQLSDDESRTLEAISVFMGGMTMPAAKLVASRGNHVDAGSVPSHLQRLVEVGLIRFSDDGGGRYSMLEPVRQIVAEGFDAAMTSRLVDAHAAFFCQLAQEARLVFETISSDQERRYLALEEEIPNFRAMLERGLERSDPTVLAAFPGLILYWYRRGGIPEGAEWVTRALDRFEPLGDEHLEALLFCAHIAMWDGEPKTALRRLEEFERRISDFGETPFLCRSHHLRGNVFAWGLGRPAEAVPHFMKAVEIARSIGYPAGLVSLLSASHSLVKTGQPEKARDLLDLVPELATLTSVATGVDGKMFADVGTDQVLGLIDLYQGALEAAEQRLVRSYETTLRLGLPTIAAQILIPVGWAQLFLGHSDEADETARKAHEMVTQEAGGFRVAEALCLLGGVALEKGDLETASRWFTIALGRAIRAPEVDLVILALAGLAAVEVTVGDGHRSARYVAQMRKLMTETRVRLPKTMERRWGLEQVGASAAEDLDMKGVLTMAKVACDLSWEEIL